MRDPIDSQKTQTRPRAGELAIAATALAILLTMLAGAWTEARWPSPAGAYVTIRTTRLAEPVATLAQLRHIDGVADVVAVFRGPLASEDVAGTGWSAAWLYANRTTAPALAFLAPDPVLQLDRGRLPTPSSTTEAVIGFELAQQLGIALGDAISIRGQPFVVVGIWEPSSRLPGNLVQISEMAADIVTLADPLTVDHYLAIPQVPGDVVPVARQIWRRLTDSEVLAPDWELARARHERLVLVMAICGAALIALLTSLVADTGAERRRAALRLWMWIGAGMAAGWVGALAVNQYAARTLGLTPFRVTPRLIAAVLIFSALLILLRTSLAGRSAVSIRILASLLTLVLCAAGCIVAGSLVESLAYSLDQAHLAAKDWLLIPGRVDNSLIQTIHRLPGVRGYAIEAYGGPVDETDARWAGAPFPSGALYGVQFAGGQGTLSVPYHLGYWKGRALDPASPNHLVLGYDLAQERDLDVGDALLIRGIPFVVVGIRERLVYDTQSDANYRADISLDALRRVLHQPSLSGQMTALIPSARNEEEKATFLGEVREKLGSGATMTVEDRQAIIAQSYPAAWTLSAATTEESVRHARSLYSSALTLLWIALLAICALSVASAVSAVQEADREPISLLKALGSDEGTLVADYVQQTLALGGAAVVVGLIFGWRLAVLLNGRAPSPSVDLVPTPRLAAAVLLTFALSAVVAAVYPTSRAVRQDAAATLYAYQPDALPSGGSQS